MLRGKSSCNTLYGIRDTRSPIAYATADHHEFSAPRPECCELLLKQLRGCDNHEPFWLALHHASAGTFLHRSDDQPEGLGRQGRGPTLAELALRLMSVKAYSTDPMLHAFEDVVRCR